MSVAPTVTGNRTTIRAVPKPTPKPMVTGRTARKVANDIEGNLFADIAADAAAAEALDVAEALDRQQIDPLVTRMGRILAAIRSDLNCPPAIYALAIDGWACYQRFVSVDRIRDEHTARASGQVDRSGAFGRRAVSGCEALLTGCEP